MRSEYQALGIDRLPAERRLALVQEIWDNLSNDLDSIPLSEEDAQEIERRLEHHRAHPEEAVPWEEVQAAAIRRLKK